MRYATEKQLKLINEMELLLDVKFNGVSIQEASLFISKHSDEYKDRQEFVFDMVYNQNNY